MNINFKTSRRLVVIFMVASLICALGDMIFLRPGTQASVYLMLLSLILMGLSILILLALCRCPWCGKRIVSGLMKVEICPHCKRDLETGLKAKGSKAKKR